MITTTHRTNSTPWILFGGIFVSGAVLYLAFRLFPQTFEHSTPVLQFRGSRVVVDFDAINHSNAPITRELSVGIGTFSPGSKGSVGYVISKHQEMSVALHAGETRHISCGFSLPDRLPNNAEIMVLK